MTTEHTVLTDDFLDEACVRYARGTNLAFARYVERAVLAKMAPKGITAFNEDGTITTPDGTYVSEAECRERERRAWDAAIHWRHCVCPPAPDKPEPCRLNKTREQFSAERDLRYPPLTPQPPEVTGPSGMRYRTFDGRLERFGHTLYGDAWHPLHLDRSITVGDAPVVAALMQEGK